MEIARSNRAMRHIPPYHPPPVPLHTLQSARPQAWQHNAANNALCGWMQGQPSGEPWLVLHGGPGSTAQAGLLAPFSPTHHWAWAPQQRGSGALAKGRAQRWHVDALVADLEALRLHLGVAKWAVLGGSWGALVGLAYVRQHPHAVGQLVLRGPFTGASADVWSLLRQLRHLRENTYPHQGPHQRLAMPAWLAGVQRVLRNATPTPSTCDTTHAWLLAETRLAAKGARAALRHASHIRAQATPAQKVALRRTWAALARQQRLRGARQRMQRRPTGAELRKVALQARVLSRRCCRSLHGAWPTWKTWLANGARLTVLQGQHDAVCGPANARKLLGLSPSPAANVRLTWVASGHLASEPAMHTALRVAVRGGPPC